MDRQQQASVRQMFTSAGKVGVSLPKPVIEASGRFEKIRAGVAEIPAHDLKGVATAVADALDRGVTPAKDAAVSQAIALSVITAPGVINHIEESASANLWDVCSERQDAIVVELRKPFDKAAATLAAAFERIGDLDLKEDSELILKKGGDIASVWASAMEGSQTIETIEAAWNGLSRFLRPNLSADRRWVNLRIIDTTAARYDEADLERRRLSAWDAVREGFDLSLPTLSEFDERRASITEQRIEIQAEAVAEPKRQSYLSVS